MLHHVVSGMVTQRTCLFQLSNRSHLLVTAYAPPVLIACSINTLYLHFIVSEDALSALSLSTVQALISQLFNEASLLLPICYNGCCAARTMLCDLTYNSYLWFSLSHFLSLAPPPPTCSCPCRAAASVVLQQAKTPAGEVFPRREDENRGNAR